jgi:DNA-binding transcriptional regulator GbsR (MarR family)
MSTRSTAKGRSNAAARHRTTAEGNAEPTEGRGAADAAPADELADEAPTGMAPVLEEPLAAQLPVFEQFFKTFGFKRVHGRIWGLLVLSGQPLSAREISNALALSQGSTSTALNELIEWGAVISEFDSSRRCHLHAPVSNTLSIVATVMRRREQVAFQQFRVAAARTLTYVHERYGEKDPRVFTLRSIVSTCEIAEAVVQLVVGAVANALDDSESLLHKAVSTALKVGVVMPSRLLLGDDVSKAMRAAARGQPVDGFGREASGPDEDSLETEAPGG